MILILRYVFCHLHRALAKTLLCLLLALALLVALGQFVVVVEQTHETVNEMYSNLEIYAVTEKRDGTRGSGITYQALRGLLDTGFSESFYAVGKGQFYWVEPASEDVDNDTFYSMPHNMFATNDVSRFIDSKIQYLTGYDTYTFAESKEFICIISDTMSMRMGYAIGDKIMLSSMDFNSRKAMSRQMREGVPFKVVGTYSATNSSEDIIVPLWTLEAAQGSFYIFGERPLVTSSEFLVRDECLRDDDAYRAAPLAVFNSLSGSSMDGYTLRFTDDELRHVVRPLEANANVLSLLLPMVAVIVVLIAAAISFLMVIHTSKDAALLRVLGMNKIHVRIALTLEQSLISFAGLVVGTSVLMFIHGTVLSGDALGIPVRTIILVAAIIQLMVTAVASGAGSIVITARKPLELLQAKE